MCVFVDNMLIHNKRLHPRRPCEPGEHYHGCMLHDMQEQNVRNSKSPVNRSRTPTSQCSASSLNLKRQKHYSTSSSNSALYSPRTSASQSPNWKSPSESSTPNKRYSVGAFPTTYDQINGLFYDAVDSSTSSSPLKSSLKTASHSNTKQKQKSKSTICLNTSLISAAADDTGKLDKRVNTVTFKCYDSPDKIIANLFPGIDGDREPKFLRKGHGAAQMAKTRTTHRDWINVGRSSSATGYYAAPTALSNDIRKPRSYSTSSDNKINKDRQRPQSYTNGTLFGIERDFVRLWCVLFV